MKRSYKNISFSTQNNTLKQKREKEKLDQYQANSKQFQSKLTSLLNKIGVQSKYVNRVSQCNMKNMEELCKVKQELNSMKQIRKLQQMNQIVLKNVNNQLSTKLNETQAELNYVVNQLFQAKKLNKKLKKQLDEYKTKNEQIHSQIIKTKRQSYLTSLKQIQNDSNISFLINCFLLQKNSQSLLYKHCLQYFNSLSYQGFFKELQQKIINYGNIKQPKNEIVNSRSHAKQRVHTQDLGRQISQRKIQRKNVQFKLQNNQTLNFPSLRLKTQNFGNDNVKIKKRKQNRSQLYSFLLTNSKNN